MGVKMTKCGFSSFNLFSALTWSARCRRSHPKRQIHCHTACRCHVGSSHFCSNVVLLGRATSSLLSFVHPCEDGAACPARDGALWRSRTDGCKSFAVHDLQHRSGPARRPRSPVQKPNSKVGQRPPAPEQPRQTESHERQRRSLADVRALATTKIAIASLGPIPRAALARAEHLAAIPPVDKRIVDAEALIFKQELVDLAGFRQEAEASGSVLRSIPLSALEAELSRVRAEVAQLKGVGRPIYFVAQRQTGLPHEGGCSDSSHANAGSSRVECVVGRTSCRLARRICCRETTFVLWKSTETTGGDMVFRECVLERPRTQDHVCCGDTAGGMNPTRAVEISSEEPLVPARNVVPRLVRLNLLPPAHRVWRRFLRVSQLWHWQVKTCSHRPPSVCSTAWAHSCLIRSLSGHVWKSRPLGDGGCERGSTPPIELVDALELNLPAAFVIPSSIGIHDEGVPSTVPSQSPDESSSVGFARWRIWSAKKMSIGVCCVGRFQFRPQQTWWKDWSMIFLSCLDPVGTMWIRRHAPPEGTPIPSSWVLETKTAQGACFSTFLDGLEEDLGAPTDVDPATTQLSSLVLTSVIPATVPASSGALQSRWSCATTFRTKGRFGPRFTRRHIAVHPGHTILIREQQVRSFG